MDFLLMGLDGGSNQIFRRNTLRKSLWQNRELKSATRTPIPVGLSFAKAGAFHPKKSLFTSVCDFS